MTPEDLVTGKDLKAQIDAITAIQTKLTAETGEKVKLEIVDSTGKKTLFNQQQLITALGQGAYDTIVGTALTSINTQLGTVKTAQQTAFDAL